MFLKTVPTNLTISAPSKPLVYFNPQISLEFQWQLYHEQCAGWEQWQGHK